MKEYQHDGDGTDIAHRKQVGIEEPMVELSIVGKLSMHYLLRDIPAHEHTGEEATQRQHIVGRQHVAEVHQWKSQHLDVVSPYRPAAEHAEHRSDDGRYPGRLHARQVELLRKECRTYLMHGNS